MPDGNRKRELILRWALFLAYAAAITFAAMLLVIVPAVVPAGKYDYGKR